jgi:hypothetical protein
MKSSLYKVFVAVLFFLSCLFSTADGQEKNNYTFNRIEHLYPWLSSGNSAGLIVKDFSDFSQVQGSFESKWGDYRNFDDPDKEFILSARTRSYVTKGKFVFYGSFGLSHFERSNLAWSGTIYPRSVINMMTDSIPGKHLGESYRISAGAGYRFNQTISAGLGFDYETTTSAKRVDGRNRNTLSSVEVRPAILFKSKSFMAGANLMYRHNAERVEYAFLSDVTGKNIYNFQGGWMYMKEGITNSSVLDRGYFSDHFGGALQGSLSSGRFNLFAELGADYGRENDYDDYNLLRRYSTVEMLKYNMKLQSEYKSEKLRHIFTLAGEIRERLSYKVENLYEPVPDESNTWNWFEYGKTLRYYDRAEAYKGSYAIETGGDKWNPSWRFLLEGGLSIYTSEFIVFPSNYNQEINISGGELSVTKHFKVGRGSLLDIILLGGAYSGWGEMIDVINPLVSGNLLIANRLMEEDYLFNTSGKVLLGGGVKYRISLNERKGTTLFIDAGLRQYQRKGLSRNFVSVNLGLKF